MIDHPDRRLRRRPSLAMILNDLRGQTETRAQVLERVHVAATLHEKRAAAADRLAALGKQLTEAETRIQEVAIQLTEHGYRGKLAVVLPGPAGHAWIHLVARHFHRGCASCRTAGTPCGAAVPAGR